MEIAKRRRHNPPRIPSVSAPPILLLPFITGILAELVCTFCGFVPAVSLCLWRSLRHWRCVVNRKTNELLASEDSHDIHRWHISMTHPHDTLLKCITHKHDTQAWHTNMTHISHPCRQQPRQHLRHIIMTQRHDTHAWHTCMTCMHDIHAWHMCMTYMHDMHAWHEPYVHDMHAWHMVIHRNRPHANPKNLVRSLVSNFG